MSKIISLITFLILLMGAKIDAAELAVNYAKNSLEIKIMNLAYPQNIIQQELKSGLPNILELVVILKQGDERFNRQLINFEITYDLWDEFYTVNTSTASKLTTRILENDQELEQMLSSLTVIAIPDTRVFVKHGLLSLSAQLFFNPIRSEKIKQIQNWLRTSNGFDEPDNENDVTADTLGNLGRNIQTQPRQGNNAPVNIASNAFVGSSGPRFKKLFDKILEDHMSDNAVAALWKSPVIQKTFVVETMQNAQQ